MASVNKVILIGNVGQDPEVRFMPNGDAVANFSIATTDIWKGKDGKQNEHTEWHRIVCYRKLAEIVQSYVKKGTSIYISGHIRSNKYTDKQGVDRVAFQINADELRLLGGKPSGLSEPKEQNKADGYQPSPDFDDFESDIPF